MDVREVDKAKLCIGCIATRDRVRVSREVGPKVVFLVHPYKC